MPRIFANSILCKNAQEAIEKINTSARFEEKQKVKAIRIIKYLFSSKSKGRASDEEAEARVDYLSDILGIEKEEVIQIVNLLRQEKILADAKDLTVFLKKKENKNRSLSILKSFGQIEKFLLAVLDNEEKTFHIKELNGQAEESGCPDVTPHKLKTILNFLAVKNLIKRQTLAYSRNHIAVLGLYEKKILEAKRARRCELAQFIVEYLNEKSTAPKAEAETLKEEVLVEFSVLELQEEFERKSTLFQTKAAPEDIEEALYYLSKIEALRIEGGFMVVYNALTIERLEQDNKKRYKTEDYKKLKQYYEHKVQQIHIVGEYARKMLSDYKAALQFVNDYFQMNYTSFLNRYFKGSRQEEIGRNITPAKFRQLFGELSPTQLKIIKDQESKYIVVAAGPGSGKTRILVHKLASLLLMEDVKHEQLLMVTFSRAAATEFKRRLLQLIGNAAKYVEIKTFHSYCFDLLGRVGTLEKSGAIIQETIRRIRSGEVEVGRITKTVLVIDEAQDMDANEFALISALMQQNDEMRVIAVGDDDQNIYEFRGASSEYLKKLITEQKAVLYELVENYRSKSNLVDFSNRFLATIPQRLKQTPIIAVQDDTGKVKLVRYRSRNLIMPLVKDILSQGLSGTTCVLTKRNEEAFQVSGLLLKNGLQAKLIQSNEGFSLVNLLEIRYFLSRLNLAEGIYTLSADLWAEAKRKLSVRFGSSLNLELCLNLLSDFEAANPQNKYKSDLEIFIRESKLEDFFGENSETIFVSTIHKAKGREFDNVFLMLDQFNSRPDEAKRQLYVAMTRAKRNLTIHYNGNFLDKGNFPGPLRTEDLIVINDARSYAPPAQLALQLTYKDVWLDSFLSSQNVIFQLSSGDMLTTEETCCRNAQGQVVLKFSRQFIKQLEALKQKQYLPATAKIRFIVYWQRENSEREIRIVLPELYFERRDEALHHNDEAFRHGSN